MAIPWFTVLQAVPWRQVIDNAPKMVDGARKFWNAVERKPPVAEDDVVDVSPAVDENAALRALRQRLTVLEKSDAELHRQMLLSSELIKNLADQNAQLIRRIEANRRHMVRLTWLAVFSVLALLAVIIFIANHHAV